MIGIMGLILSVAVFILLSYKNWNIAFVSIVSGTIVLLSNHMNLWASFSQIYAQGFSEFCEKWWMLFILGTVFGRCMQETGFSTSMSRILYSFFRGNVIIAVLAISFVLSYGGIGTFIIAFTVYPIAKGLFEKANISTSILPATILFCPTTLCMTMLPGTPSVQNIIPTQFLETSIYAAPICGIVVSIITGTMGYLYLKYVSHKSGSTSLNTDTGINNPDESLKIRLKDYASFLPCVSLWVIAFIMIRCGYDSQMAVGIAMIVAITICVLLRFRNFNQKESFDLGIRQGLQTLAMTSCIMGYGALVQSTDSFQQCVNFLLNISISPLTSSIIAINMIAAITGSSTASLQLYYQIFAEQLSKIGLTNDYIHRITAIASGGLDSMPYATGVVVTNDMAKTKLKDTYGHIFVTCAIIPLISLCLFLLILKCKIVPV